MVVMVVVDRQAARVLAEQLDEGRVAADLLGVPGAAYMAVQADHLVGWRSSPRCRSWETISTPQP
ncbi:Uncharacterised protein [Pseudomonas aeruginosa]|nr:Uncharacterised protein [Pseudomonas aeruginosa]